MQSVIATLHQFVHSPISFQMHHVAVRCALCKNFSLGCVRNTESQHALFIIRVSFPHSGRVCAPVQKKCVLHSRTHQTDWAMRRAWRSVILHEQKPLGFHEFDVNCWFYILLQSHNTNARLHTIYVARSIGEEIISVSSAWLKLFLKVQPINDMEVIYWWEIKQSLINWIQSERKKSKILWDM